MRNLKIPLQWELRPDWKQRNLILELSFWFRRLSHAYGANTFFSDWSGSQETEELPEVSVGAGTHYNCCVSCPGLEFHSFHFGLIQSFKKNPGNFLFHFAVSTGSGWAVRLAFCSSCQNFLSGNCGTNVQILTWFYIGLWKIQVIYGSHGGEKIKCKLFEITETSAKHKEQTKL